MRIRRVLVGVAVALAGCGSDPLSTTRVVNGLMTAGLTTPGDTLELFWAAELSLTATVAGNTLTIIGEDFRERRITLQLYGVPVDAAHVSDLRTFGLGPDSGATVGFAQYAEPPNISFSTIQSGGSGTVTITHLSDSRVAGTFAFLATRPAGNGPGTGLTRRARDGAFDVRFR